MNSHKSPTLSRAHALTEVNAVIRAKLHSEVALVSQIADYIIGAGGKRLRPRVLLLVAAALGYSGSKAHQLAAVIELIHTATLLHDDVVDESELRRGRKTANAMFGNAASVLVGDFLYSRAFQMMAEAGSMEVMDVLSEATNVIAEGEVLQLMNIGQADIGEESYLRVIRYKTAKLFEAAGRLGAIVANADHTTKARMGEFGMRLGTAFQLTDDVLDYVGNADTTGKNIGDDLAEGKPTLPLIRILSCGTAAEKAAVRMAITEPGSVSLATIQDALAANDAIGYTQRAAVLEAERAQDCLSGLPESDSKQTLLQFCVLAVERTS